MRLLRLGELLIEGLQQVEVGAGTKRIFARSDHNTFDGGVSGSLFDDIGKFAEHAAVKNVHRPARRVPGDKRNAVGVASQV